ncbi:MAG: catechol 2,3-dioxygenase-like lactoylglutathione lyase family enzyme [Flavobacterium sp.]|jgi:catechol 2,3-dioxygenase-like lactoylglutathione lyase family enzyme
MQSHLSGIQQIGIGVGNAEQAMYLYKELFGLDVLIFDDQAEANLMTQYTGNKVHSRRAILTMNLQGGGGFEIWQFKDRKPLENINNYYGAIGIYAAIIKSREIHKSWNRFKNRKDVTITELEKDSSGQLYFWLTDELKNKYKISEFKHWFQDLKKDIGGVVGGVIGVSNMEKSIAFYQNVLGLNTMIYDDTFSQNGVEFRKVGLVKKAIGVGAFDALLGDVFIELVQAEKPTQKIFQDRFWGDCGFIHLCFDVVCMDSLKENAKKYNHEFSVDSEKSFGMDAAAGRFCYIQDPDGTLIELVETHKVPILKKLGLFLNLKNRKKGKPLPNFLIKLLALSKVK